MWQIGVLILRRHVKPKVPGADVLRDSRWAQACLVREHPGVGGWGPEKDPTGTVTFLSAELKK